MMSKKCLLIAGTICFSVIVRLYPVNASTNNFRYAYVSYESDVFPVKTITINTVDPDHLSDAVALFSLPTPKIGESTYLPFLKGIPSPDGNWIALIYRAEGA